MSEEIIEKVSLDDLAQIIRASGYRAVTYEEKGKHELEFTSNGYKCSIFYSEEEARAKGGLTEFTVYAIVSGEKIIDAFDLNEYNRRLIAGHCHISERGNIFYDLRVNLAGGVTRQFLLKLFSRWDKDLGAFLRFVSFAEQKAVELKRKMDEICKSNSQNKEGKSER